MQSQTATSMLHPYWGAIKFNTISTIIAGTAALSWNTTKINQSSLKLIIFNSLNCFKLNGQANAAKYFGIIPFLETPISMMIYTYY